MQKFNLNSKNIKITIIDSKDKNTNNDDCFFELIVERNRLKDFLLNTLLLNETTSVKILPLTGREKQVLEYLASGKNNAQIAKILNVSIHTAKVHVHNIFYKLSVQDRTEAVVKAIKYKLIEI